MIELPESPLTRENYFDFKEHEGKPVIHASCLSEIYSGQGGSIKRLLAYFEREKQQDKPYQSLGKLFHKYLENKKDFVVSPETLPEPGVVKVVERMFSSQDGWIKEFTVMANTDEISPEWFTKLWPMIGQVAVKSAREVAYQGKWGDDAIWKKIGAEGEGYWKFLCESSGHQILTAKQKEQFDGMSKSVLDSPWAERLFSKEALHEVPILFKMIVDGQEIWCKALLDWVMFHPTGIDVTDFKTTSKPIGNFYSREEIELIGVVPYCKHAIVPGPFWNYRYYRQLAFYRAAVRDLFLQLNPGWKKRVPPITANCMAVETGVPYECRLDPVDEGALMLGDVEIQGSMFDIANHYKTLKKY